jgi:hypothetical protein
MTGPSIGTSGNLDTLYTANQAPIVVDGAVTISDPDSATLSTGYVTGLPPEKWSSLMYGL